MPGLPQPGFQVLTLPLTRVCVQSEGPFSTPHEPVSHPHFRRDSNQTSLGSILMDLTSAAFVDAEIDVIIWRQRLPGELLHQKPLWVSISAREKIS